MIETIMQDIQSKLNEAAITVLREEKKKYHFWCRKDLAPKKARPVEAYETDREIVIMFGDRDIPESHNCDEMGCGQDHVWMRIQKAEGSEK